MIEYLPRSESTLSSLGGVGTKQFAKYLGIMVDSKMSFSDQIACTADKAKKSITTLSKLMANVGGSK